MRRGLPRPAETVAVSVLLAIGFYLRLTSLKGGLPFPSNVDELVSNVMPATRVPITGVDRELMFYPGAYMYLCYLVFGTFHGFGNTLTEALRNNPTDLLLEARTISAVASCLTLPALWLAGRHALGKLVALFALALAATMFLPVAYAHMSVDDSLVTLAVTVCLLTTIAAMRTGHFGWLLGSGAAAGLALGAKYTGGFIMAAPLTALALHYKSEGLGQTLKKGILVGLAGVAVFAITTPYAFIHPHQFLHDLRVLNFINSHQWAGEPEKHASIYYLWSLSWGYGIPALAMTVIGFAMMLRRERGLALVLLVPVSILLITSLTKATYFARFLLPAYPLMILAAAYASARIVRLISERLPKGAAVAPALSVLVVALVTANSLIHSLHFNKAWARPSTYELAANWIQTNIPQNSTIVVDRWLMPWWPSKSGNPGYRLVPRFSLAKQKLRDSNSIIGEIVGLSYRSAKVETLNQFEQQRYCWVETSSSQAGRAANEPSLFPEAMRYYDTLHQSRGFLMYQASPYKDSQQLSPPQGPTKLNFDWATNNYPLSVERSGPLISIYWLKTCGKPPVKAAS